MSRVLIAEDSATQAEALRSILEDAGHRVKVAQDGVGALAFARDETFDAIISDVMMPGMTGYELCRRLKDDPSTAGVPVLLLTSLANPQDVLRGLEAGAANYLTKPYEPEELLGRLRRLIDGERALSSSPLHTKVEAKFQGHQFTLAVDASQIVSYFLSSFEDFIRSKDRQHEQEIASEVLRESLAFVEGALDSLPTAIAVLDEEGLVRSANSAWRRHFPHHASGEPYLDQLAALAGDDRTLPVALSSVLRGERLNTHLDAVPMGTGPERHDVHAARFEVGDEIFFVVSHEDVTPLWIAYQRERTQYRVTRALAGANDLDEVAPRMLEVLGDGLDWDLAELWMRGERDDEIVCHSRWSRVAIEATDRMRVTHGFPGEVLATGRAITVEDVRSDPRFERTDFAKRVGLTVAICVPVTKSGEVVGAIHLMGRRGRWRTERSLEAVGDLAQQLGQFLARRQAEADVRERARQLAESEAVVREQAARLEAIFQAAADGIVVVNRDGGVVMANPTAQHLIGASAGQSRTEVERCMFTEDGEPLAEGQTPVARALAGESTDDLPLSLEHSDRGMTFLRFSGRPLPGGGAVVLFRDDTERRKAEDALRRAYKLEAVGRLAGGIAHDFNNYLSVITSYSTLLAGELPAGSQMRMDVDEISAAAERAARLTRQLLAFGRRQVLMPRAVDVNEVVTGLERLMKRLVGDQVQLSITPARQHAVVTADSGQLEQVLVNLVVNARDAIAEGGMVAIQIEVLESIEEPIHTPEGARELEGSWVRLSVKDTGSGIEPALLDRIFEPFFTTKAPGKGTGLGLATVYGIVSQSGGYLTLQTALGEGSKFQILFPKARGGAEAKISSVPPEAPARLRGSETVLLVEDDDAVRQVAARSLREYGYTVLESPGAGEALLILERHSAPIHLLVTDVMMPLMSGGELEQRVRERWPAIRALFVTGFAGVHETRLAPDVPVLGKPFQPADLAAAVRQALDTPRD